MDLISLSHKALRKPLHPKNFFVLFFTMFIVLIIGLSIISSVHLFISDTSSNTCASKESKRVSGKISVSRQAVYQINYDGNENCNLTASFTWKNPSDVASIWFYDPKGEIEVFEPVKNQTSAKIAKSSPLNQGRYRFVVKSEQTADQNYSGNISVK